MPVYRIDTFKAWANREIERAWSNSYEIVSEDDSPADLVQVANDFVAAERLLHLPQVEFLQVRVSTYEAEPTGLYDPNSFVTIPLTGVGARSNTGNTDPLDYNCCFVVQRVPSTGRAGRLFYRGCLAEGDVTAVLDGTFRLIPTSPILAAAVFPAYQALLDVYVGNTITQANAISLAMASTIGGALNVRLVQDLRQGGVSINKRNHRYFDRGANG